MSKVCLLLLVSCAFYVCTATKSAPNHGGKTWALLVAGSNEYDNYRHQADVCHAYHIIKAHGVKDENIIVMMYDDIANNTDNPTPGIILNTPGGPNVYKDVPKDYTGEHVTPENFLSVLKGDYEKMAGIGSGKVINSSENDHVFVFYSDHGGPGILGFIDDELYAEDLQKTLIEIADQKKFHTLVMFVEACHAGSMFDDILPDDMNIFIVAAADPNESSYACCYSDTYDTYLGDEFSVNWMKLVEETASNGVLQNPLHHLYSKVRTKTEGSHVEEYGNLNLGSTVMSEFLGSHNGTNSSIPSSKRTLYPDPVTAYGMRYADGKWGPIRKGPVNEVLTDGPANEDPVHKGPVNEDPVHEGPVNEDPVHKGPVNEDPVHKGPVNDQLNRRTRQVDGGPIRNLLNHGPLHIEPESHQHAHHHHYHHHRNHHHHHNGVNSQFRETVPSLEVPLEILRRKEAKAQTNEEKSSYQKEIQTILLRREMVEGVVDNVLRDVAGNDENKLEQMKSTHYKINTKNMHCAKVVTKGFSDRCFKIAKNPYVLSQVHKLVRLCNIDWFKEEMLLASVQNICSDLEPQIGIV